MRATVIEDTMAKFLFSRSVSCSLTGKKSDRCGEVVGLVLTIWFCLSVWIAGEWCCLRREQQAITVLERDYHAGALAHVIASTESSWKPSIDLSELQYGRLYAPIERVSLHRATIDRRAWEELAAFRYLTSLTFQDCQIEPGTEVRLAGLGSLKRLDLWHTSVTIDSLRSVSRLRQLESLTLQGTGMNGEWLQYVARLPSMTSLCVNEVDLSDGAADSLAHLQGLTELQLDHVKIDSKFGPAIAKLEKLEALVIVETPFDDDGAKYLVDLKNLKVLFLAGTAISDGGMASVGKLLNLWRLSIGHTKVGDAGVRHVSQLPKLAGLDIQGTRVTNSCLPILATMPALKSALVDDTAISASSPGFIGVLDDDTWYPDAAKAKAAEEYSMGDENPSDETDAPK